MVIFFFFYHFCGVFLSSHSFYITNWYFSIKMFSLLSPSQFLISLYCKDSLVKSMVFPVVMYGCELDYNESWVPHNSCFWTVVLEKTLKSPLYCKEIQPVHPKGNQSWIFIGRTDVEAEIGQYLGQLMRRSDSSEKTLMLGKTEGRRRGWQRMR